MTFDVVQKQKTFRSARQAFTLGLFSLHFGPICDPNCSFSYSSYGSILLAQKNKNTMVFEGWETIFGMVVLHGNVKKVRVGIFFPCVSFSPFRSAVSF